MTPTDSDPDDEHADTMQTFKEGIEALDDLSRRFSEENARDIAACQELGLMWQRDPYLAPFCHVIGMTAGTVGADMRVGIAVTRAALKTLVSVQSPTDFVTTVLAGHPEGADPQVQRELLARATLTVFCIQKVAATVPAAKREEAMHKFIETVCKGIEFMMRDEAAPTTH
jgi:hypothetical protein